LPKDWNSRKSKLGSLWSIKSKDIGIPESVAEALKQAYCNLLHESSQKGFDLRSLYEYTWSVEARRATLLDRILWRLLTTHYYDYISELDGTKQRLSPAENRGVAFVVARICESRMHDPDAVRARVTGWVKLGRRYRGFMQALCSGCIIVFPERIRDLV
jgi:hypothetical protein